MKKILILLLFLPIFCFAQTKNIAPDGGNLVKKDEDGNVNIQGLYLDEITTPPAINSKGAIYPKDDNKLYFQDGAGTEHTLNLNGSDYGEMGNVYGSDATEVLAEANKWYAMYHANITGSAPHLNFGFTFTAGSNGTIASVANNGNGKPRFTDNDHGLLDGDIVTIQSTEGNYDGIGVVANKTANTFDIETMTYNNAATGFWQMGSYLKCATAGQYRGVWTSIVTQTSTNKKVHITPYIGIAQATKAYSCRLFSGASDTGTQAGNGLMDFGVGDRIWFAVQSDNAQTITFKVRNVSVR